MWGKFVIIYYNSCSLSCSSGHSNKWYENKKTHWCPCSSNVRPFLPPISHMMMLWSEAPENSSLWTGSHHRAPILPETQTQTVKMGRMVRYELTPWLPLVPTGRTTAKSTSASQLWGYKILCPTNLATELNNGLRDLVVIKGFYILPFL